MMAVETFVYLYIIGFGLSAILAISLLIAAARMITRDDRERKDKLEAPQNAAREHVHTMDNED